MCSPRQKLKKILNKMNGFSGAEVKAVVTEAGYFAIRDDRTTVTEADFFKAIIKVRRIEENEGKDFKRMFG